MSLLPPTVPVDLGGSRAAASLREQLDRAADCSRVLVCGPRGSGQAAAALAIHERGPRAGRPLNRVLAGGPDAAALLAASCGLEGTLHVDLVEVLDRGGQEALMALLEGSSPPAALVATGEADLLGVDRPDAFDEELAYTLNIASVTLPPLADRRDDLPELAEAMTAELSRRRGLALTLSPEAIDDLSERDWPGNMEELELILARAVLVARGSQVQPADLGAAAGTSGRADVIPLSDRRLATVERTLIERVLDECGGNRSQAARLLGLNRSTLYNKLSAWSEG